jgi:hypothetical protein
VHPVLRGEVSRLKSLVASAMDRGLQRFGFQIRPVAAPLRDLRSVASDPIEALYRSDGRPFLIDVDVERLRGQGALGMKYAAGIGHPFIETLAAYATGRLTGYAGSPAEAFYRQWRPRNAAEALKVDLASASAVLRSMPAYATLSPWFIDDPATFLRTREHWLRIEHEPYGYEIEPGQHGTLVNGPWSQIKGDVEFTRLVTVYESIRTRGYRPDGTAGGHVYGHLMIRGSDWRFKVRNGNHRLAALIALGWRRVPVLVVSGTGTPRRDEVHAWPNVRRGVFSADDAAAVFDRIFDGTTAADFVPRPAGARPASAPSATPFQRLDAGRAPRERRY